MGRMKDVLIRPNMFKNGAITVDGGWNVDECYYYYGNVDSR